MLSISMLTPAVIVYLLYKWNLSRGGVFRRLEQRQWLGRMIVNQKMYATVTVRRSNGKTSVSKEKIVYFPKVYYHYSKGMIYLRFPLDLQQYQERFLKMQENLENAFYCDCTNVKQEVGYVVYELLYDPSKRRKDVSEI
ncbi:hypothetical protein [Carnobacterium divergens]|uniref:hypothetical protein n=1 Tax=Carnobacterium divergens TaxID=2748 RepID=UPI0039AEB394